MVDQQALTATVPTWSGELVAGLHPAAGGDGHLACSADIVLQALVACGGVTLAAVATSLGLDLRKAELTARATWDARGTLGVDPEAPVGLTGVELVVDVEAWTSDGIRAGDSVIDRLLELTEKYCVVARTLTAPGTLEVRRA
ncbi:OsmC family protein [Ornithinimicrobium sp. Y1847]|uniref:OsmC family protein n=1 Tax=Ornithinimicrobium sp. Y1847 TaxID=3405419 RepID=UPI003B673095